VNELADIVDRIKQGQAPAETVRMLLQRFGFEKRGYHKVRDVRRALQSAGLVTVPDFNAVSLDSAILYKLASSVDPPAEDNDAIPNATGVLDEGPGSERADDPAYRMNRLEDTTQALVSVNPDDELRRATTLMMTNDFSQLPVMTNARSLKGMVSWRTVGLSFALGGSPRLVREAMQQEVTVIESEVGLFSAIPRIISDDYAMIRRSDRSFWIITTSDLSLRFRELTEPFLLLSEIENQLRRLLDGTIPLELLIHARDPEGEPRLVEAAADLTLGEVIRLLEQPDVWSHLAPQLDRIEIISRLDRIRTIRNDVMHFDPEGVEPNDLESLRSFARFLQDFRRWGSPRRARALRAEDG
jgi:CBS domain-containing protein